MRRYLLAGYDDAGNEITADEVLDPVELGDVYEARSIRWWDE